jgi:hypothetical protein
MLEAMGLVTLMLYLLHVVSVGSVLILLQILLVLSSGSILLAEVRKSKIRSWKV